MLSPIFKFKKINCTNAGWEEIWLFLNLKKSQDFSAYKFSVSLQYSLVEALSLKKKCLLHPHYVPATVCNLFSRESLQDSYMFQYFTDKKTNEFVHCTLLLNFRTAIPI